MQSISDCCEIIIQERTCQATSFRLGCRPNAAELSTDERLLLPHIEIFKEVRIRHCDKLHRKCQRY